MERVRSELSLTNQNLTNQITTVHQENQSLATEVSTLTRTIQKLNEKLTNPDFINPLYPTHPNPFPQNTTPQNSPTNDHPPFTGENNSHHNPWELDDEEEERGNWRLRKLDLPVFNGEDPDGWLIQAERYFSFYNLREKGKMGSAVVSLEGAALQWFHWEHQRRPIRRWEELKGIILRRFRPVEEGTLHEQWMMVEQRGSVAEYNLEFIEKGNPLGAIPEKYAMGAYFKGLEESVRRELRLLEPVSLDHAMSLATMIDLKNPQKPNFPSYPRRQVATYKNPPTHVPTPLTPQKLYNPPQSLTCPQIYPLPTTNTRNLPTSHQPNQIMTQNQNRGRLKLTHREMMDKRAKGICFTCDEKWSYNHICKNRRELNVILGSGEAEEEVVEEEEEILVEEETVAKISLQSVVGISSPKTMKMRRTVNGRPIVVMIDSGATNNFISTQRVQQLNLPFNTHEKFGVMLGNGERIKGAGVCQGVTVEIQNIEIVDDFLMLELGNTDMILGLQWLEKLGEIVVNWKEQIMKFQWGMEMIVLKGDPSLGNSQVSMKFQWGMEMIVLKGDPSLGNSQVSLKAMMRTLRKEKQGIWVELNTISESKDGGPAAIPVFLKPVMEKYQEVFGDITALPPSRPHDHAIHLREGTNPVSVRPYRYPQIQKDEIEKMVREMLQARIIRPSNNPFSSPIILVKKKDGSWRFCVDYRALNKVTVADKYPIPMIDELLDELHGASIFTKLDLKSGYIGSCDKVLGSEWFKQLG